MTKTILAALTIALGLSVSAVNASATPYGSVLPENYIGAQGLNR